MLQGALGTAALTFLGGPREALGQLAAAPLLGFEKLPVSIEDRVFVPEGYRAEVLYAWGDPISDGPRWDANATNTAEEQEKQAGMHHDGIHYFPLPYGSTTSDHGLLAMNHEYTDDGLLHQSGMEPWTPEKVRKSQAAHGVSVVEVRLRKGAWSLVRPSPYARRITAYTPIRISGPAAGHPLMATAADPAGTRVLGTLNNCANGATPWGTYLTCEENFNGYFANLSGSAPAAQRRYRVVTAAAEYRWHEHDGRFDAAAHPNEFNRFGWVVEIDPYDPTHTPVKRTALGRFKHEGATVTLAADGRVVVYMGDDERFDVYKFVSRDRYNPSSREANVGLLGSGTLYVARFNDDGSGAWIELSHGVNGLDASAGFRDQGGVLVNARLAADRVGATKMDRPEWIAVHPQTGEVYGSLTNNSQRGDSGRPGIDKANPRVRNTYGHIIRWREDTGAGALSFRWDIFVLAGDPASPTPANRGSIKGDIFGSPDGLWFDPRGVLWIQTDVSTSSLYRTDYANMGNNQMLAADPRTGEIRRFLTGPRNCEVTGVVMTPDMKTLFVNIQHPGEPTSGNNDPKNPGANSTWPDGPGVRRPRAATIVIRRVDGGTIGA